MRALSIDECMTVAGGGDPPPTVDEITVTAQPLPSCPSVEVIGISPWGLAGGAAVNSDCDYFIFTGIGAPRGINVSNDNHDEKEPTLHVEGGTGGFLIGVWEPADGDDARLQRYESYFNP